MAISVEPIKIMSQQTRCIPSPGRHVLTVTDWYFQDHTNGRDVVFEMCSDDGEQQRVRFGLGKPELSTGVLHRFLVVVLQRRQVRPNGMQLRTFLHMAFNQMVGRRVVLAVETTSRGAPIVVDWEAVPQYEAEAVQSSNGEGSPIEVGLNKDAVAC